MKTPTIWNLKSLLSSCSTLSASSDGNVWYPCRPETTVPSIRHRIHAAWLVFCGKADAVIWPMNQ